MMSATKSQFGGSWTKQKLGILEKYLDAYTTALKNQSFNLLYIDAFAGNGEVSLKHNQENEGQDWQEFIEGSAKRALKVRDKQFDKLIFIEKEEGSYNKLTNLKDENSERSIEIYNENANEYLQNKLRMDWHRWRGVLFLDPFATEVEWKTIEKIADYKALDTWILFPTSAIMRMLPVSENPDDITCSEQLTKVFGDQSWKNLYRPSPQQGIFEDERSHRIRGTEEILKLYKNKLADLFGSRFLKESKALKNSKGAPLFEFIFCSGNPKGASIANKIAQHIITEL